MEKETTYNKALPFYGPFTLIYTVLNIAAFVIMLLTTEWSVLADDEADGFGVGFFFMVLGIAAALIHGIGPAIMFKRRGITKSLYLFPLAVMLVGFAVFPFEPCAVTIGVFLIFPLSCPLFNCFAYNSPMLNGGIWDSTWFSILFISVTSAVIYALVILLTTLLLRRNQPKS